MPGSPASSGRSRSPGQSATKTKRSTVSAAFNTTGPSVTAATLTNSAVAYGNSTVKERSVSKRTSSPTSSSSQRATSVVTVGTVTNPDATASELLAAKMPNLAANSTSAAKSPIASAANQLASVNANPSIATAATTSASGIGVGDGPSISQGSVAKSPAQPALAARHQETMVAPSSMADGQVSSVAGAQPAVGHGIVDVTNRTGAKLEMIFSIIGAILFTILWIYMLAFALCYRDDTWIFLTKTFSAFGVVGCLFVLFHSCFEKRFTMGRGVFGCIIFFIIAVIVFLNLVDAFMAMNCICKCSTGTNAFSSGQSEDLIIFSLSLAGSFTLIAILLVSSVAHEEHHGHHHQPHHSS